MFVGVRCTNGARQSKVCNQYASFRVDGSPPTCAPAGSILLGSGARSAYQADRRTLSVRQLAASMIDRESGIAFVRYASSLRLSLSYLAGLLEVVVSLLTSMPPYVLL